MKTNLLLVIAIVFKVSNLCSQSPQIEGDLMLCPDGIGTASIINQTNYDTYQWYYKYWFTADPFQPINSANSHTFIYDWLTYDQALLKVVVTLGGNTYESNTIQIDSYAWSGLVVEHEFSDGVEYDPDNGFLMCEGDYIQNTVGLPYTIFQWYKDGVPIPNATLQDYKIGTPGVYYVEAAPSFCPEFISTSIPIVVMEAPDCNLNVPKHDFDLIKVFPNPTDGLVQIKLKKSFIYNIELKNIYGKILFEKINLEGDFKIDLSKMQSGTYFLNLSSMGYSKLLRIVRD